MTKKMNIIMQATFLGEDNESYEKITYGDLVFL